MEQSLLFAKVVSHIGEFLEVDVTHLRPDSNLATALPNLDSLKLFEMMLYLEECFQLRFDEQVVSRLGTVAELVEYVTELQPSSAGADKSLAEGGRP
jgi:acyl carrier protein